VYRWRPRSPGPRRLRSDAALRNLSLASCPNKTEELLAVLAANVTVLVPGSEPLLLNDSTLQEDFFTSSFLPCGVRFTIADIAVGEGASVPEPAPTPEPTLSASGASNGDSLALAVTHLFYIDYATLSVGKALALWEGEKVKSPKAGANGQDRVRMEADCHWVELWTSLPPLPPLLLLFLLFGE